MSRKFPLEALAFIALSVNFATSFLMYFIWENLALHFVSALIFSFLGGAFFVKFDTSIVRIAVSFIIGIVLSILVNFLPPIIYGGVTRQLSMGFDLYMVQLARILVVSFPLIILATVFGCFVAQAYED